MGYTSKDIAVITEPKIVSLNAAPNFVQFASKPGLKTFFEADVEVNVTNFNRVNPSAITDGQAIYPPDGVIAPLSIAGYTPYISANPSAVYTLLNQNVNKVGAFNVFFYDEAYNLLGYYTQGNTAAWTFTSMARSRYMRFNLLGPTSAPGVTYANYGVFTGAAPAFAAYNSNLTDATISTRTLLRLTEPSGTIHTFRGTTVQEEAGGSVFFVSGEPSDTAENLRQALIANRWIKANFEVKIPFTWVGGSPTNGNKINIQSKGSGAEFIISIAAPNNTADTAYTITIVSATSVNNDSISGEETTAEIELDIYTDPAVFLGQDDRPITPEAIGNYATTLQKTYAGIPLWFELNAFFSQYAAFNRPPGTYGWFDTGTARTYRFIAKKRGVNSFSFYQSNALYVLNGYGYPSEDLDFNEYVYVDAPIKLLSNKPRTTYVRGQKEFLNFIFSDPQRGIPAPVNFSLAVAYRVYSTSDQYLGIVYGPARARQDFAVVNTCALDIDSVLDAYPKAGIVRVALVRDASLVSNDLEYQIRPDCLHTLNQVVFLNRLGGWEGFNFDAANREEIKPSQETYSKTVTPDYTKGESIETVYSTALANSVTIEGAPVTDAVADWLKELGAARVILDAEGNYLIREDFTLPFSATAVNMQIPTLKYRLSETYTND